MSKRIMIVDDSSIMRKMVRKTLETQGHVIVGEAKDGKEAIALYPLCSPDIVTMDITMREMDGFAAAKEILDHDKKARIIFLSNLNEETYSREARELGGIGYVNKHNSKEILTIIADNKI
ncbi:Chemotaxis protein [Desulfonema limicola]|uniref:Chemotaxis protein n=1 Tax=Desulfonema limicola TaxID=45656 RepID=A0A975GEK7_9BACT|nr:response regulator [Desulfonema limicola]QTA78298.1 Chemotaxis protein [Desulfonema limicola]